MNSTIERNKNYFLFILLQLINNANTTPESYDIGIFFTVIKIKLLPDRFSLLR